MSTDMENNLLKKLELQSRGKQEQFISRISARLGRSEIPKKPEHPFKGAPSYWNEFELSDEGRLTLFSENWQAAGGHVVRKSTMDEVKSWIAATAEALHAKRVLRQRQPELDALELEKALTEAEILVWDELLLEERLMAAAGADIGIVVVDHAVAYTGSIVVKSSAQKGRSVSLLPTVLFLVVPMERLRTRLGEVLRTFAAAPREELPAGIHFISGPSRSADIENDLTIGVHGPGVVYAIIVG